MLYQIGAVQLNTFPFNADAVSQSGSGSTVSKSVLGVLNKREKTGEGDETLSLSGSILPTKIGGLDELEMLNSYRKSGDAVPVLRGDGKAMGWFVVDSFKQNHTNLTRNGVGFNVNYTVGLIKTSPATDPKIIHHLTELF